MANRPERVKIELLGTTFSIQSDEDPEYLRSMLLFLEEKIAQVKDSVPLADPLKISILTSLLIADELFKSRQEPSSESPLSRTDNDLFSEEVSEITQRLIRQLDAALTEEEPSD
ncbi:MAG: cell division protein ZapA [Spirochaetales bacterium]|nr:cell division protein ZapA [Spirochaetales bacterium]